MSARTVDRRAFLGLGAGILGIAVAPRALRGGARLHRWTIPVMGTVAEIAILDPHAGRAGALLRAAGGELRATERLMTRFDPRSDVGRFNAAPVGHRVPVSPETAEVVRAALDWAARGDGAFDPTLGALTPLWDPGAGGRPPGDVRLAGARSASGGWRAVEVESDGTRATLLRADGSALDLGGIAKGWGVDRAADLLAGAGVESALVNVGGDLVAIGSAPDGAPWTIGIRDPRDPRGTLRTLEIEDAAVATSGDYLRGFSHGGVWYGHILHPGSGRPHVGPTRSITVTARRALDADAAATLAFVVGPDEATLRFGASRRAPRVLHSA